jgi:uncharacterized membrane protein YuzA (DUF378 family)
LQNGFFSNQKIQFGVNFEALLMEKMVGVFFGHFEYITAIWYILWPFGDLVAIWYIFPSFGILRREKSGNPGHYIRVPT